MPEHEAALTQLNLVVREMAATTAFYQRLGMVVQAAPGGRHAVALAANGLRLEFDSTEFVAQWDTGWKGATGGSTVLGFSVSTRDVVDATYTDLVGAGYRGRQPPYDAFWGARYAIVDDPDGNGVGLMSPIEEARAFWPPQRPPTAT